MQVSDVIANVLRRSGAQKSPRSARCPHRPIAPCFGARTHRPFELVETRPPVRVRQLRDGLGDQPEPDADHDGPRSDAHGGQNLEDGVQHNEDRLKCGQYIEKCQGCLFFTF